MDDLKLVLPSKEHEKQAFEYIQEFLDYNSEIHGSGGLHKFKEYSEWLRKVEQESDSLNTPVGKVPASTYFLIRTSDNKIIGMVNIRHKLNEFLLKEGGHVGYSIRPTERRNGFGTLILKLSLQKCMELKIDKVLVTCDKINTASAKVIQNNGGVLENEFYSETYSEIVQRYWIEMEA